MLEAGRDYKEAGTRGKRPSAFLDRSMNILSIQSHVTYGHVGNAAAMFPLQRLGHDVWAINTVGFSNHLGYPTWRGRTHTSAEVREILDGLDLLGALKRCDAVLSGYLGAADHVAVILDAVRRIKAANPKAIYVC
ncbi:MAG: pyridoxal kinase, partial [Dongiaceae bacterium]